VSAFDLNTGKDIWHKNVKPKKEDDDVISGGLAYSSGKLYVTSGYNELLALNPENGGIVWKIKLSSPSRAAPSVLNDRVFVSTLDNKISAYSATDGKPLWDYQALSEVAGIVGAASPGVNNDIVVPAFSSGEILALRVENGAMVWQDDLSPTSSVGNLTALPDIQGMPVLDKDLVFAISFGGKMVAINQKTGQRVWQKEISGAETPWVVGNMIFLLTSNNELLAIARDTGVIAWVRPLQGYIKEDAGRQGLLWNGPVLAGGRLILTGPEGNMLEVDPNTGNMIRRMKLSESVAVSPVVADGILLLLTEKGNLLAYQ
jgi:outer membrane protein assembly factor BamB